MRIGVLTVLYSHMNFPDVLDKVAQMGVSAVEIGTGGYPGDAHLDLDHLLENQNAREFYLKEINDRDLIISAFSCHGNPIHPNPETAEQADSTFRKTVKLAKLMGVPVVNTFSGLPAGCAEDKMPNWVTCAWPSHFLEILEYQWEDIAIPYWKNAAGFAGDHGIKIGIEMHPGMLIYNVATLLRMREEAGPALGANFDPSHLLWNGVDPILAVRKLGAAIHHVHGKDCYIDPLNIKINGCNDYTPYNQLQERSWTFRTIGYGHDLKFWKDFVSALRLAGYDHVISIEHEDPLMSNDEGLSKAVSTLKEAVMSEKPGEMYWV